MSDEPVRAVSEEESGASDPLPEYAVMMVASVIVDLPDTFATVSLQEHEPPFRAFQFPVGLADGAAIAAVTEERPAARPSTQDLFATTLKRTGVDVIAARITGVANGNYLAEVDFLTQSGRVVLECRPSDAINLALRHPGRAPILVDATLCD
jgi:bifunctional DNase/RNase